MFNTSIFTLKDKMEIVYKSSLIPYSDISSDLDNAFQVLVVCQIYMERDETYILTCDHRRLKSAYDQS